MKLIRFLNLILYKLLEIDFKSLFIRIVDYRDIKLKY